MKTNHCSTLKALMLSASVAALTACGGGGSDGSGGAVGGTPAVPSGQVLLTALNGPQVAVDATLTAAGFAGGAGQLVDTVAQPAANLNIVNRAGGPVPGSEIQNGALRKTHRLSRLLMQTVERLDLQAPPRLAGLVIPIACPGGGRIDRDDHDGTTLITATFVGCALEPGFPEDLTNGTLELSNIDNQGLASFSATVTANLTFTSSGADDGSLAGSFTLSIVRDMGVVTVSLDGAELIAVDPSATPFAVTERLSNFHLVSVHDNKLTIDPNDDTTTDTGTFTYASTAIGGSVSVSITADVVSNFDHFPHTGVIEIVGAAGTKIRVTINGNELDPPPPDQLTIDFDLDGNPGFDATSGHSWFELLGI